MQLLLDIAWLIPFVPFAGALFVMLLLISFNRTMNRLSKPVSYFLMFCVGLSTVLSMILFENHLSGDILDWDLELLNSKFHFGLHIDSIASLVIAITGIAVLIIMIISYNLMDRKKGYVRYFMLLSLASGSIFSFLLSSNILAKFL